MSYLSSIALVFLSSAAMLFTGEAASKRGLTNLAEVIKTYTGRDAFDYNNYGCWCGVGGKGTPKDAVDRCCQAHDRCYDGTKCTVPEQFIPTKQSCRGRSCVCQDKPDSCERQACTCDVKFGECLSRTTYNAQYKGKC